MGCARRVWICCVACAALACGAGAKAASPENFAVRLDGGGVLCAGSPARVDVLLDLDLAGAGGVPVRGFTLAICHRSHQLRLAEARPGADLAATNPDFLLTTFKSLGVIQTVIVDLQGVRSIAPVNGYRAMELDYEVIDAADPAPVFPCNKAIGSPPAAILFTTASAAFTPPASHLKGIEIVSPCDPQERTFRLHTTLAAPLRIDPDTGTGSTVVRVALSEDPVACCPPRLLRGIHFTAGFANDLAVRFFPVDVPVIGFQTSETEGCAQVAAVFMVSTRFGAPTPILDVEIRTRSEFWRGLDAPTERLLRLAGECPGGPDVGAVYLDGRVAPFADTDALTITIPARPYRAYFLRGDVNADGLRDIADAIRLLSWLYATPGDAPPCLDAADANDDGLIDIADAITILVKIFGNGMPFPPPSDACGPDPTPDGLSCAAFPPCE